MPQKLTERHERYCKALKPIVPILEKKIDNSSTGQIEIKTMDIAKQMGPEFEKKHPTHIYWGQNIVYSEKVYMSAEKIKNLY